MTAEVFALAALGRWWTHGASRAILRFAKSGLGKGAAVDTPAGRRKSREDDIGVGLGLSNDGSEGGSPDIPWTQLFGLAALEIGFLLSVGDLIAGDGDHRNWWIAGAVVMQFFFVGAVVETLRRRRPHRSQHQSQ